MRRLRRCASGYPVSDSIGGITAAFAIASALVGRERSWQRSLHRCVDARLDDCDDGLGRFELSDRRPSNRSRWATTTSRPRRRARSRPATGLLNIAANTDEQFEALAKLIERPDLLRRPAIPDTGAAQTQPRNADAADRNGAAPAVRQVLGGSAQSRGCACWPRSQRPQALELPQVKHRELVQKVSDVPGLPEDISVRAGRLSLLRMTVLPTDLRPPTLGQHTDEILKHLGYSDADIEGIAREERHMTTRFANIAGQGAVPGGTRASSISIRARSAIRGYPIQESDRAS